MFLLAKRSLQVQAVKQPEFNWFSTYFLNIKATFFLTKRSLQVQAARQPEFLTLAGTIDHDFIK